MDPPPDEPTEDEWANMTMEELIPLSSFGTPEAVARRATCPRSVVDEIMARLTADWDAEKAAPGIKPPDAQGDRGA